MFKKLKPYIVLDKKKIIKFDETEIEEYKFYQYKSPISINNKNVNETNKFPFGKQHFK